ncbi:MAG: hypothetical protein R3B40_11045 [Polyangiales bacterium]|nr:hypothetical protein [Myxococcales bacterium]MCB9658011.1 hypothetical protein [Sandaracinaceae bacterium]
MIVVTAVSGCAANPSVGAGDPCGATPTLIEALDGAGEGLGAVPDVLDVGLCREGRYRETLPLGSAWVELRRVGRCCEVWLGGETEDPSYDGSPQQFCRFSRSGVTHVPIHVGRVMGSAIDIAGPARTCEDTPACTVGLPPVGPCPNP